MELEEKVVTLVWCNSILAVTQNFWKEIEKICLLLPPLDHNIAYTVSILACKQEFDL
jgi:hypothetical protein